MNLQNFFQDFNPSKFLVYVCLLVFSLLLALRLDGTIQCSFWTVFLPIWFWKATVVIGALVGTLIWFRHPQYRLEGEGYLHYKAMLICLALHMLLLMFELLACDKLETGRHLWILVFIPLIFISIVSIAICVWAVKHDRSFELELFCSVNILQFIFLALRLDEFILWTWVVVFVPLWIVMSVAFIGVLYAIIFAGILLRTADVNREQRRTSVHSAIAYSFLVVPILVCLVLVTNKLDGDASYSFLSTVSPLFVTFTALIYLSFGSKGGNHWWFGIRKDFCQFLLGVCPLLQEYGNISYSLHSDEPVTVRDGDVDGDDEGGLVLDVEIAATKPRGKSSRKRGLGSSEPALGEPRPCAPRLCIESPD